MGEKGTCFWIYIYIFVMAGLIPKSLPFTKRKDNRKQEKRPAEPHN